jgi:hypothetical protein
MIPEEDATQEARMSRWLVSHGYQQRYGTSDSAIRKNLAVVGRCADFVGYHPGRGMWLIAESKGGNIYGVETQLGNTLHGLLGVEPEAIEAVELLLYVSMYQYTRLSLEEVSGYAIQDGFLGYRDEKEVFHFTEIEGIRVKIESENALW